MTTTPPVIPQSAIERAARAMSERRAELIAQPVARIYGELFTAALQSLGDEWCLGWQSIETAPRDGTEFIGLIGNRATTVKWQTYIVWTNKLDGGGNADSGDRTFGWSERTWDAHIPCNPARWMPLPKLPAHTQPDTVKE